MKLYKNMLCNFKSCTALRWAHPLVFMNSAVFSAAILACGLMSSAIAATSVSQYGITWNFSEDRPVGQFVNGDWWVIGPITITSITPADTNPGDGIDMHGTMVNPSNWQAPGWDSRIQQGLYNSANNMSKKLPLVVQNNSSVMTCKSFVATAVGNEPQLDVVGILTVLPSAPPEGCFRPPYIGPVKLTNWVKWSKSNLDYSKLKNLPPVSGAPTFSEMESYFEHTLIHLWPNWNSTYLHPRSHDYPGYGREISKKIGMAALILNLSYSNTQKEKLLIGIVQRGIDIYGISMNGGGFQGQAGHSNGRKLPMMIAGFVLNDPAILARANNYFSEDEQHFYISQADVNLARKTGDGTTREPFTTAMIGTPEWGPNPVGEPASCGSNWGLDYRNVCGSGNIGVALSARIMGLQAAWNDQAFFDYFDRYYNIEAVQNGRVATTTNYIHPFVAAMWQAYRNDGGSVVTPPPVAVSFAVGDRVETTRTTNVRASGALTGTLLGTQTAGSLGTILTGPVQMDNITWWKINYDNGVDGWSGEDNFIKATNQVTLPTTPTGLKVVK